MRILGSLVGVFAWRLRLGLAGLRLRFRGVLSALLVLGGAGAALGYALAKRVLDDQEGASTQRDA